MGATPQPGRSARVTTAKSLRTYRLPDRPERAPDDRTNFRQLTATSIVAALRHYLGDPETTLITGDHYLCRAIVPSLAGSQCPDLLIAFDADIEAHKRSNGYVIAEQGKPPDFVLEIASQRTGREDSGNKRKDYAGFGIAEYWRFDETKDGRWHGARLAGDRLVDGAYQPIPIEQHRGGILEGYSRILNLHLRWENGNLRWHKPGTTRPIATFADERLRADREREARLQAEARADQAREARLQAEARAAEARERADREEARADRAREARLQAEARVRELEARLGGK